MVCFRNPADRSLPHVRAHSAVSPAQGLSSSSAQEDMELEEAQAEEDPQLREHLLDTDWENCKRLLEADHMCDHDHTSQNLIDVCASMSPE